MSTTADATVTSLDGFHATPTAQRADELARALVISRGAMPDGRALRTHMVAENNRVASRSVWDDTLTGSGQPVDFTTLDFFRIEDGAHRRALGVRRLGPGLPVLRAALRGGRRCLSPQLRAHSRPAWRLASRPTTDRS